MPNVTGCDVCDVCDAEAEPDDLSDTELKFGQVFEKGFFNGK